MVYSLRIIGLLGLVLCSGCTDQPRRSSMYPPFSVPDDRTTIHPWISELLDSDVEGVAVAIQRRMTSETHPDLAPMKEITRGFVPCRIEFTRDTGYILCLKPSAIGRTMIDASDQLYIAQPLPNELIVERAAFFDERIQSLMQEFFRRFSGCGEEKEDNAGQFVMKHFPTASEITGRDASELRDWSNSRLLYLATNGDSVLINKSGGTAWNVFEAGETVPLFSTFPEFIKHYADFRKTSNVFDSWASLDRLGRDPWKSRDQAVTPSRR